MDVLAVSLPGIVDDNDLILRASEFMGGSRYKTWRIYDLPLEASN